MDTNSPRTERRRHLRKGSERFNKLIRASIHPAGSEESEELYAFISNMSEQGMQVNVDRPFPEQTPVTLSFSLDGFGDGLETELTDFRALVECIWQKRLVGGTWIVGLEFKEIDDALRRLVGSMLETYPSEGRRLWFRLRKVFGVSLRKSEQDPWIICSAIDISVGGACILVANMDLDFDMVLDKGESIELALSLDQVNVHAMARVIWCESHAGGGRKFGLQFENISDESAGQIYSYIKRMAHKR